MENHRRKRALHREKDISSGPDRRRGDKGMRRSGDLPFGSLSGGEGEAGERQADGLDGQKSGAAAQMV